MQVSLYDPITLSIQYDINDTIYKNLFNLIRKCLYMFE